MPSSKGYSDFVQDVKSILTAAEANSAELAHLEDQLKGIETHLGDLEAVKARQEPAVGERRRATQELKAMLEKGRVLVLHYRAAVKSVLGYKNEVLAQFGMAPFRKRVRKAKPAATEPPVSESARAK